MNEQLVPCSSKDVLHCPFCASPAREQPHWAKHYGCSDENCGAYHAAVSLEQWNRRADATPEVARLRADNERLMHHVRVSPCLSNQYVLLAETEIAAQRAACEELRATARNKATGNETSDLSVKRHSRNCDCHDCHYAKKHPQVKPHHATCGCFECAPRPKTTAGLVREIAERHDRVSKLLWGPGALPGTMLGPMDADAAHTDRARLLSLLTPEQRGELKANSIPGEGCGCSMPYCKICNPENGSEQ